MTNGVRRVTGIVALLALAVWLGGLVALGAVAAPIVFGTVPMPAAADAMTLVFRRFDSVAMVCAAVVLATEAARVLARIPYARADHARAALSVVAAGLCVFEGARVAPRIAALHFQGAVRGLGESGMELNRLHDLAEQVGKAELAVLALVVGLHAWRLAQ
jgi:hypothetical protein